MNEVDTALGERLLRKFRTEGFTGLLDEQPRMLANYLAASASETGSEATLFLSRAIGKAYGFLVDEGERGGTTADFMERLNDLTFTRLDAILTGDLLDRVLAAEAYYGRIAWLVGSYDPSS